MIYPSCSSSLGFGGLPLPGTLRTASRAVSSYKAPAKQGLMLALARRLAAVLYEIPSSSAISCMVRPVMVIAKLSAKKSLKKADFSLDFIMKSFHNKSWNGKTFHALPDMANSLLGKELCQRK